MSLEPQRHREEKNTSLIFIYVDKFIRKGCWGTVTVHGEAQAVESRVGPQPVRSLADLFRSIFLSSRYDKNYCTPVNRVSCVWPHGGLCQGCW